MRKGLLVLCGICGMAAPNPAQVSMDIIRSMTDALAHRGPDDFGFFEENGFALGHRRLSIIDLTENGHQPLLYGDRYVIAYNGEIYNYIELRDELRLSGYEFHTQTDTEVICAAYDAWGTDCQQRFNGMWAFAIYDRQRGELFCSRDRFGIKPFYYTLAQGRFLFASEIKALLCDPEVPRRANSPIVFDFLTQGLLDHTNQTFFEGIYKLPQGHYMFIDKSLQINPVAYYSIEFSDETGDGVTDGQIRKFAELFTQSVRLRLRSDVPVGSCLSGGLDSSAIVCAISNIRAEEQSSTQQHTFSSCPNDKRVDESEYMRAVIQKTGVMDNMVVPDSDGLLKILDMIVYHQDEPFGSTSIYAGMEVMRRAGAVGMRVLQDGQGADEILCGYRKSRIYYIRKLLRERRRLKAVYELVQSASQIKTSLSLSSDIDKAKRILGISAGKLSTFTDCLNGEFLANEAGIGYDRSKNFQYNDLMVISVPVLLRYADRNSMACSIESRLPFLDYRLVEFCASLPLSAKLADGYSKVIMRKAVDLPEKVRKRKDKMGYGTPGDTWVREQSEYFRGLFSADSFRSSRFADRFKILSDWEDIISGKKDVGIWRYISLELWMRRFEVE